MLIDKGKLLCHIHISVEINVTVGGMIISSVEIQEILVSKIRNRLRRTTGLTTISDIGEQGIQNFSLQHIISRRKSSLHLIINHTVYGKFLGLIVQFIMPALLAENGLVAVNIGIQHRIQIHVHQILEVLIIAAGYRIQSLVRISHSV